METYPWRNGYYKVTGTIVYLIKLQDGKAEVRGSNDFLKIILKRVEGEDGNKVKLVYDYDVPMEESGMVVDDGRGIVFNGMMGDCKAELISEEEAEKIESDGDPINAPLCPYEPQPSKVGKCIWIAGAPGTGKSTAASILGRNHGYIYYEGDCFASIKNPYIPTSHKAPSMAQVDQRPLVGPGLEERKRIALAGWEAMISYMGGKCGPDALCELFFHQSLDVARERKRLGGDFVVAGVAPSRKLRDLIRKNIGEDIVIIVLEMDREMSMDRLRKRHDAEKGTDLEELLEGFSTFSDTPEGDEDGVFQIKLSLGMEKEDVVERILEKIKQ